MIKRLPLILLIIVVGAVFWPLLSGQVFFWGLPTLQFVPWRDYSIELIRSGQLPLWNPYNGAGAPLLANYQSSLLYPLNWITVILPAAWSMSLLAVLHLLIAGMGMWAFTGRLGLPAFGRGVSTLAFALTSYLVARLGTYPVIQSAAWLPWLMWAVLGVLEQGNRRSFAWVTAFAALQLLAGHAQTTWYSFLLAGGFCLYRTLIPSGTQIPSLIQRGQRLALAASAVVLAVLIAGVQLAATAELLVHSGRAEGEDMERVMNFSYGTLRTANLLLPNFFGNPGRGNYISGGAFFEDAVYVGLLPVVAAVAALIVWIRRRRDMLLRDVPFWWAIGIVAFLLALGDNTPLFPFLYNTIPTFDAFQAPVRWHLWTVFALSILGGIGVSYAWAHGKWRTFWTRLFTAGSAGAAVLALLLIQPSFGLLPESLRTNEGFAVLVTAITETAVLAAVLGVLHLTMPEPGLRWRGLWETAVLVVLASDLAYAAPGLNPMIAQDFFKSDDTYNDQRSYWTADAEAEIQLRQHFIFDDYTAALNRLPQVRASGLPNLNLLDRDYQLSNFEPLQIGHHEQYVALLDQSQGAVRENLLRAAGTTTLIMLNEDEQVITETLAQVPRAWLVSSACWHNDEAALIAAISSPEWNPYAQVHLLGDGGCPPQPQDVNVNAAHPIGSRVSFEGGGTDQWLVVADTHYPGWTAQVCDDLNTCDEAYIYRANLTFRAVQVLQGTHVRFDYRPAWLLPSTLVSLLALIALWVIVRTRNPEEV